VTVFSFGPAIVLRSVRRWSNSCCTSKDNFQGLG
jgi:hypothetical protein